MEKLPVIFRKSEGEVTAVFPTLPFDRAGSQVTVYAHVGQHGGASMDWYYQTSEAHPHEYAPLLDELRAIYERDPDAVELVVKERYSATLRHDFMAEVRRLNLPA